jgi:hypothetical protein
LWGAPFFFFKIDGMGLFDWPITKKMLSIFGQLQKIDILFFLWANYIGYKRRTFGQWKHTFSNNNNNNKISIALLWLNQ